MIGIYRITSPTNRIYIGQSINIQRRLKEYSRLNSKSQPRLSKSIFKYGIENHKFEVIEECEIEKLNERERYWQDYYDVLSPHGLNCFLTSTTENKLVMSKETRAKISKGHLGKKLSKESIIKRTKKVLGSKRSKDTCLKITLSRIGSKNPMYNKPAHNRKIVFNMENGVYYESSKEASYSTIWGYKYFSEMLTGKKRNKTSMIYV